MFNFLELSICIMVLFFPLMVYSYYVLYKRNFKEKEKDIILNLILFITLFLIINVLEYFDNNIYSIFCIIPILFCYIYRKTSMIVIISIVVSIYIYSILNINIVYIIILNLLYIISYLAYIRTNRNVVFLIKTFFLSTSIMLVLSLLIKYGTKILDTRLFVMIIFYFILMLLVIYCNKKTNEIVSIYMTLKEFEHEKQIKTSLFKITHEIKNPLAAVSGYLQMYDAEDIKKSKKYIKIIKQEVDRMLNLLDDFMEFTKIKVTKEQTNFNSLLDEVKKTIIPISKKFNVNYNFQIEDNIIIELDPNRMKQVIINIVKNAIEASKEEGKVEIISYKDDNNLYIYIKDNGIGMTKEVMDKLLKPFFTTKTNGTGLGISLSNEIILAHGGTLEYTSKVGEGTTFKIILPI